VNPTPLIQVPVLPAEWDYSFIGQWDWTRLPVLSTFVLWDGSRPATQPTYLRLCASAHALYVRFDCEDRDIWGTFTRRDEPLYEEEVVEVFLASGEPDPLNYFEFEVSPNGVLFDARVHNPGDRRDPRFTVEVGWDCPGLQWAAGIQSDQRAWWVGLVIPWRSLCPSERLPDTWRANFYRIERPRDGEAEFSCWSPTLTASPDFHVPARFGTLHWKVR